MNEELFIKRKRIKIVACIMLFSYIVGNWVATQFIASDCYYNELLGIHFSLGTIHIYPPYAFYQWNHDQLLLQAIPDILDKNGKFVDVFVIIGLLLSYMTTKGMGKNVSHGSARFATAKEIEKAKLNAKESGLVIGINPYTDTLMLDDEVTHDLLVAPTRSGKGVNTIIPTGMIWEHSIFFFDVKGELWDTTAGYRQKVLHQKVMKFEPLCIDGSTARWNPLAEINFQTMEEFNDVKTIVTILVKPDGDDKKGDPFWDNANMLLLCGFIIHLLYQHYQERRPLPSLSDLMSFISSPDKDTGELFEYMKVYPHISKEEFLELEYIDEKSGMKKRYKNVLKEMYGEYIRDFTAFNEELNCQVKSLDEIREVILKRDNVDFDRTPFSMLLTHPKVAETAANMLNTAEQTRASIMMSAQTALALYQNPTVQRNTAVSDFCIRDLLDPSKEVSLYLAMQFDDVETLKPLSRLFINTLLSKLIRDMKFDAEERKQQRLLLMLDEFPQLGKLGKMEQALAVCAGYGIKICVVAQDVNQINKEYTKDNSIASNCHTHIYFTPNLESGGATAATISKALGKKTITTNSHSDGGGLFKGSNSQSYMSRDLMTPDEVARMDAKRELVFVAGQRPIFGKKLKWFEKEFFLKRKLTKPIFSDTATCIQNYDQLFTVHAAEYKERLERKRIVEEAKINAKRMSLEKEKMPNAESDKSFENQELEYEENSREIAEGTWDETSGKIVEKGESNEGVGINSQSSCLGEPEESILEKEEKVAALMQTFMQKQDDFVTTEQGEDKNGNSK